MAIGIDIDEVLFPLLAPHCEFLNKKYNIHLEESQFKTYDFWENLAYLDDGERVSKEQATEDFYEFIATPEFRKIKPYPDAVKAVSELKNLDFLVAITSRQNELKNHTKWQLGYFFPKVFSDVVFGNKYAKNNSPEISKQKLCKDNDVKLLFEDNLHYALEVSKNAQVILFDKPWNQNCPINVSNIYKVKDWLDAPIIAKALYRKYNLRYE